jgi:sterol desaturase/sphingolipid hydroxylase (fatty acid hydroxylase superfamily)
MLPGMAQIPAPSETAMQTTREILRAYADYALGILASPLDPENRIYFVYLATSAIAAFFVYEAARRRGGGESSFLRFLFPRHVWQHPSAWLDLRYFFFHLLIGHFLMLGLGAWSAALAFGLVTGEPSIGSFLRRTGTFSAADFAIAAGYMFASMAVIDFVAFLTHYLQHRLPILWQFHKVHHSAEVMHPISNFREHPVDNLVYKLVTGLGIGAVSGLAVNVFGYVPSVPSLLGVPLLMLAFNLLAYNLRHSHVWLRWPGRWSMILPSPAHHQIHHSCHPDHIDKNFAFMFPIWDVIFRTYCLPEDNRDVKFGIGEGEADELGTCLQLYLVPFRDAYRLVRRRLRRIARHRRAFAGGDRFRTRRSPAPPAEARPGPPRARAS